MLRTAEEYIQKHLSIEGRHKQMFYAEMSEAVNEARKDLLIELSERTYIADNNFHPVITKEEILKLIDELK